MKYTVHIYATVRVPIKVKAENQLDAITEAQRIFDEAPASAIRLSVSEYAEDITGYFVDEGADKENRDYSKSRDYDSDMKLISQPRL